MKLARSGQGPRLLALAMTALAMGAAIFAYEAGRVWSETRSQAIAAREAGETASFATILVDDLQTERRHAVAFTLGAPGAERYGDSQAATDETIALLFAELDALEARGLQDPRERAAVASVRETLSRLPLARERVDSGAYGLDQTVGAYSGVIAVALGDLNDLFARMDLSDSFSLAFTALAGLQDRAAVETGMGLLAAQGATLETETRRQLSNMRAEQLIYARQFRVHAPAEWAARLVEVINAPDVLRLERARLQLATPGDPAPSADAMEGWAEAMIARHQSLGVLRNRFVQARVEAVTASLEAGAARARGMFFIALVFAAGAVFAAWLSGVRALAPAKAPEPAALKPRAEGAL